MDEAGSGRNGPLFKRIFWHVILTHFPISFFMISAGFMVLHLFTDSVCFEKTAFLCLAAGTTALLPAAAAAYASVELLGLTGVRNEMYLVVIGFALVGASAFTAMYSRWWGEKGGQWATIVLRNVLGIPLWISGFVIAWIELIGPGTERSRHGKEVRPTRRRVRGPQARASSRSTGSLRGGQHHERRLK